MMIFPRIFLLLWLFSAGFAISVPAFAIAPAVPIATPHVEEIGLVLFNRPVIRFRATFFGASPAARAQRAQMLFNELVEAGGPLAVTVQPHAEGQVVLIDERLLFVVTSGDADPLTQETPETLAQEAARRLERIIAETHEARDSRAFIKALVATSAATLLLVLVLWALGRLRAKVAKALVVLAERKTANLRVGQMPVLDNRHLAPLVGRMLHGLRWLLVAVLAYEWLGFVLSRFAYTRPWGEQLNAYLWSTAGSLFTGIAGAIPGLGLALAIFLLARLFIGFMNGFFARTAYTEEALPWLNRETMPTTRRLFGIAVWLFAIAMAYPYLPGAQTEAFKGLSVLIGLMVSLGASSLVGQGAAGLILTYTRTLRIGDYVRIGDQEGTVVETGMFTTRLRTGAGAELTLPNSLITGNITKNFSCGAPKAAYLVETTVTIGYDTAWRQVNALLLEAVARTPEILAEPVPRVLQTALSDYYPEYRLVAYARHVQPMTRADVLSRLHANIQDVFNEYGVQIMSPHYRDDPAEAKLVAPEGWHPPPAKGEDA